MISTRPSTRAPEKGPSPSRAVHGHLRCRRSKMAKTVTMRGLQVSQAPVPRFHPSPAARIAPHSALTHAARLQMFISDVRGCPNKEAEERRVEKELAKIREKFGSTKHLSCKPLHAVPTSPVLF